MIYRYTYIILCTAGSFKHHYYIGCHKTKKLDDGYKGSGYLLGNYYKKHPNDYYMIKLCFYDTDKEMQDAERDLISKVLGNQFCLNLVAGGGGHKGAPKKGRTSPFKDHHHTEETKNKLSNIVTEYFKNPENRKKTGEKNKGKIPWNKGISFLAGEKNPMYGKNPEDYMTPEAIIEKRRKSSEAVKGEKNPMYGKSANKGKHRVYDNSEKTKYHYE